MIAVVSDGNGREEAVKSDLVHGGTMEDGYWADRLSDKQRTKYLSKSVNFVHGVESF